jgi:putative ABC transport system substrate-binding protein
VPAEAICVAIAPTGDRIAIGGKADLSADLPVEFPTRFQFIINLKTVKSLGLTVSPAHLTSADEVIE